MFTRLLLVVTLLTPLMYPPGYIGMAARTALTDSYMAFGAREANVVSEIARIDGNGLRAKALNITNNATIGGTNTAANFALSAPQWTDVQMNYGYSVLGPSSPTLTAVTNGSVIQELAFDNDDILYAQSQFPHNVAVTNATFPQFYFEPHVHFSTVGTLDATHSNVTWRAEWSMAGINQTFNILGTNTVTVGVTNNFTHYSVGLGAITNSIPQGISAVFRCRLMRPASAAQDYSNAHDVLLEGMDLHVPVGNSTAIGSRLIHSQ